MDNKKTKIVCTVGPSSWDPKVLKQLALSGMNVARLNFSHGNHQEKGEQIKHLRQISKEIGKPIAIMADMQGPKMRLGEIEGRIDIKKGQKIALALNPVEDELPIQFDIAPFIKRGQRIFLNDGLIEVKVTEIRGKTVEGIAQNYGWVSSHKGVNIPDTNLKGASFTQKDFEDCEFALKMGVEYVALSFVQNVKDLEPAKKLVKQYERKDGDHTLSTKIVVKVEKNEAIQALEEIVKATDAIMVARGDLAIEIDASEVPVQQQRMLRLCRQYQKPIIVATQMLESMTENPRPTRAETSDVANAVLDQVDAVMLSAESANGKYPVEAVETMSSIIKTVEKHPDYSNYIKINWDNISQEDLNFNAIVSSAASIGHRIKAKMIVVATATGRTAKLLASFRPDAKILAITHNELVNDQMSLVWGVDSIIVKPTKDPVVFWDHIAKVLREEKLIQKGDKIVIVSGSKVGMTGGTDDIKIVTL